jgi:hypothetical protein
VAIYGRSAEGILIEGRRWRWRILQQLTELHPRLRSQHGRYSWPLLRLEAAPFGKDCVCVWHIARAGVVHVVSYIVSGYPLLRLRTHGDCTLCDVLVTCTGTYVLLVVHLQRV